MLPLAHHLRRERTQHKHVDQPRNHGRGHWKKGLKAVLSGYETRKTEGLSAFAGSQCNNNRGGRLDGEIDGKCCSLQLGELRAWKRSKGDYP